MRWFAGKKSEKKSDADLNDPLVQEMLRLKELERQLDAERKAIQEMPKQLKQKQMEMSATLPPPDDLEFRARRKQFEERSASMGEVRNERNAQVRGLWLTLLLGATLVSLLMYAWHVWQRL